MLTFSRLKKNMGCVRLKLHSRLLKKTLSKPNKLILRNHKKEHYQFKKRLTLILILACLLYLAVLTRLFFLQIIQYNTYTTLSQHNHFAILPIAPKRGLIYDRNGQLLAENIPVSSLDIVPEETSNLSKTLHDLTQVIPINQHEIDSFIKQRHRYPPFTKIPIKIKLNESEIARFAVNQYRFPGVYVTARLIRYYPLGSLTTFTVGHVGQINDNDLKSIDRSNYVDSRYIGKTGIEKYYESMLHGKTGVQQVEINASGQIVRTLKRIDPIPGDTLYLTLDSHLQQAAQKALQSYSGAVVAIDPQTGDILAMVSEPTFDPNIFVTRLTNQRYIQLQHSPNNPLFNRATLGQFPLASTIKPLLALQALDKKLISPQTTFYDPGWFQLPHSQHRYHDLSVHRWVNLHKAIVVSCDTYFYKLAYMMGIKEIDDILYRFGFGEPTGIDMPRESSGLVASPKWKYRHKHQPWFPGDTVISGIGQGAMLTTPLQLASATSAIANRGDRMRPKLMLKTIKPDGSTYFSPNQNRAPVMLQHFDIWQQIIEAMQDVIRSPNGTGFRFGRNTDYTVAGKTGTAQLYSLNQRGRRIQSQLPKKLRDDSWFIAFAPVKHPKIAIAVIVEHAPFAPKIAREVLDAYFKKRVINEHQSF